MNLPAQKISAVLAFLLLLMTAVFAPAQDKQTADQLAPEDVPLLHESRHDFAERPARRDGLGRTKGGAALLSLNFD